MSWPTLRQRGCCSSGMSPKSALDPHRSLEQHEEGHEGDRQRRDDGGDDALRDGQRSTGADRETPDAAVLDRLLHLLDDVVARLEEAEPAPPVRQVGDVGGNLVREAVNLVDERRYEQRREAGDDGQCEHGDDARREPAPRHAVGLQPADRRVEGEREEERDQEPAHDVARHPQDVEHDADEDQDPQHGEDRPRLERDDALDSHERKFRARLPLPLPRFCRLRRR